MKKLWRLLTKDTDKTTTQQAIDNIPETVIEDIILEEQEEYDKVRKTTTRFLRSKYGSATVDRTLRRLDKRRQREQTEEKPKSEVNHNFSLSDLLKLNGKTTKSKDNVEFTFKNDEETV